MHIRELFQPHPMGVNATLVLNGTKIGGFIAVTGGTLTITQPEPSKETGTITLVNAVPMTGGDYLPLPISLNTEGTVVTLAGGASGTLLT